MKIIYLLLIGVVSSTLMAAPSKPTPLPREKKFSVSGSFIFWKPYQEHLDLGVQFPYTITNDDTQPNQQTSISSTGVEIIKLKPGYSPGFKLSAGYILEHDNWAIIADYTHFNSHAKKSENQPLGNMMTPAYIEMEWFSEITFPVGAGPFVSAKWDLNTNVVNLGLEKIWKTSPSITVRPFVGAAAAWIKQDFRENITTYTPLSFPSELFIKVAVDSNAWAVGPRLGIGADWNIISRLSLIGYTGFDLLYTHYNLKTNQSSLNDDTLYFKAHNKVTTFRVESDLAIALSWKEKIDRNTDLELSVGYDFQAWFNQNMIRWFINSLSEFETAQGNLYLQGLTVTAKLRF